LPHSGKKKRGYGFAAKKLYIIIRFWWWRVFCPLPIGGIRLTVQKPQAIFNAILSVLAYRIPKKRLFEKSFQHVPFLCVYHFITALYAIFRACHLTPLIDRLFCGFWRDFWRLFFNIFATF